MSMFLTAYRNRTCSWTITITDAAGANVVLEVTDSLRLKIGRAGESPLLDLKSGVASTNGSTLSAANPTTFVLDQDDAQSLQPGAYDVEINVVDDSDGDRIKHATVGVLAIHPSQAGSISL